ncbi:MAG: ABC transporter permease subunit [Acholeplasmataceae bacterium]|nr:ABC transporter permease subunit [Acholeplasmataceae bacterium]
MINMALYKKEMKSNLMVFLIFLGLSMLYGIIVTELFDPAIENQSWIEMLRDIYPEMLDFVGFNIGNLTNYQYFISGYLYGMLFIIFGLIFANILSNRLLFRYIDRGSIAFLLATPNSRTKIISTQIKVLGTYLSMMALSMYLIVSVFGEIFNPSYVDFGKLLYLNISFFLLLCFISAIMALCHSLLDGKIAVGSSIGIPVFFFFLKLISNLGEQYEFVSYFTPFSLFDPILCVNYDGLSFVYNGILIVLTAILYGLTIYGFNKRDLSV